MPLFDYRTFVSFEEANVVGNVYFANYFVWQGKCREAFLSRYAPRVLDDFKAGYGMITKDSSCVFQNEAFAFERILIRMGLDKLTRTGIAMEFDYYREEDGGGLTLLAQGRQTTIWISPEHRVAMLPPYLFEAIKKFVDAETETREAEQA